MRRQALNRRGMTMLATVAVATSCASIAMARPRSETSRQRVNVAGMTKSVGSPAPGTIEDRGTVSGKPFGAGKIDLFATFEADQKMSGTFTIRNHHGTASGTMATSYVIEGNEITFTGTAEFTGGTGTYRGITGKKLKAYDHNTLDGQSGTITLKGFARF